MLYQVVDQSAQENECNRNDHIDAKEAEVRVYIRFPRRLGQRSFECVYGGTGVLVGA